ncbi:MAG TPA: hypothetical protein VEZ44_09220 [bacterium]|nr:hypothetical protein [bacterium]
MPTSTATLVYTATSAAVTPAFLGTQMSAVPLPQDILDLYGLRVISDGLTGTAVRTIVLGLLPVAAATATATRFPGNPTGSPIESLTLTAHGTGYTAPPTVIITDSPPVLPPPPGGGFRNDSFGFGAQAIAELDVASLTLVDGGTGYTSPPTVTVVGGLSPGGTPAVVTANEIAGSVTILTLVSKGKGYVSVPQLVFSGGGAPLTPAIATAALEVGDLVLLSPGQRYVNPLVEIRPRFKTFFPDSGDQRAPFWNLIKAQMERYLAMPVFAAAPVIA